jgi:hypothetical protein
MTKFNLLILAFLMACSTAASNAKDLKTEDETNLDLVANESRGLRRCADGSRHCHEYEKEPLDLTMMTTRTTMIMITSSYDYLDEYYEYPDEDLSYDYESSAVSYPDGDYSYEYDYEYRQNLRG